MKVADAIQGIRQLGFDTAPLIYFIEKNSTHADVIRYIMQQVDTGRSLGVMYWLGVTIFVLSPLIKKSREKQQKFVPAITSSYQTPFMWLLQ